jgi:CrcB protein
MSVPAPTGPAPASEPVDPDVGPAAPARTSALRAADLAVLGAIAAGGIAGAEARYAVGRWLGAASGTWPWSTWGINVLGSFLLGALMVVLTELTSPHRLLRPFLGVGVLGGFTTFSTALVEVAELIRDGRPGPALLYLVGTALAALLAAALGVAVVRGAGAGWRRRRHGRWAR